MANHRFFAVMSLIAATFLVAQMPCAATDKLTAGWRHTMMIEDDATALAWGDGRYGQLGDGRWDASRIPVPVVGPDGTGRLTGLVAVSAGQHHTLALDQDGRVWAWGNNTFGQLGDGRWGLDAHSSIPRQVLGPEGQGVLEDVVAVAAGWDHSVALLADGTVWAWGSRCQGQLGDGRRDSNSWSAVPTPVAGTANEPILDRIVAVACGAFHTLALRDDGTLLSWGGNDEGQLGRGALARRMHRLSLQVPWTAPRQGSWSIALGYTYSDPSHRDVADRVALIDEFDGDPLQVVIEEADATPRTAVSNRQADHVMMRARIGYPTEARLGVPILLDLQEILVGQNLRDDDYAEQIHLLLTHRETGEVVRIDLGDGLDLTLARPAPVVAPDGNGRLNDVHQLACGEYHSVALRKDGSVWAWGYNATGQLGNGSRTATAIPVQMAAGSSGQGFVEDIVAVAAGYESTYVLDRTGTAWACGWNVYGQLGADEPAHSAGGYPSLRQVRLDNGNGAVVQGLATITAGAYHALARQTDGQLLAWGHNGFGQLGDGTVQDRASAVVSASLQADFRPPPAHTSATAAPPAPDVPLLLVDIDPSSTVRDVRQHGATGDGVHLDQTAIQKAIDAVHQAGGGTVLLPAGTYRSGTLFLRSHVRLHLESGATILGSTNRQHYQTDRARPGVIVAQDAENIAITGAGVIDGQGHFCPNRGWRHRIFSIYDCDGVTIEGITTKNAGSWTQHYVNCRNLVIRGVTVNSVRPRRNNDGIDLSGCQDVLIEGCIVASEDDAIVIKSQSADLVNRNIRVINNTVYTLCNGFKLGTETRGDFEDIVCEDLRAFGGSTLAVWSVDGSRVRRVRISNVRAADSRFPLGIRLGARLRESYFSEGEERVPGILEDVVIRDVQIVMRQRAFRDVLLDHGIENAPVAHQLWIRPAETSFISGLPGHPVRNVLLEDVRISYPGGGTADEANIQVPERPTAYPNAGMFGRLPAWGLYVRDAEAITTERLQLSLQQPDERPAIVIEPSASLEDLLP